MRKGRLVALDMRLYALIDPEHSGGNDIAELARQVAEGGATLLQMRDKRSGTRVMIEHAARIRAMVAPLRRPFIVNDRVDVALACGADGVHLGEEDMRAEDARRLLGRTAVIGLSLKSDTEAESAPLAIVDYVGIGGVFATTSKQNTAPPIGIAGLARLAAIVRRRAPALPVCAIAGITADNASQAIAAGADGVAVISALAQESNPKAAARRMRVAIDAALAERDRR
jgi:thiamine-phosphate pyrophosphorylase